MIVLHYIPDMALSSGIVPEYVNILVRSTLQVATSHIVTERDLGRHIFLFRRDFLRQLELYSPDVVHIHACWNFRAAYAESLARSKGFLTIVSPHEGLSPENMELNFWRDRLPRILAYQLRMVRRCSAVFAASEKELHDMQQLNWKRSLALIPHPLTFELSDEETASLLMPAYRKVIDTNYRKRLTIEEEMLMHNCLKAAVWKAENPTDDEAENEMSDVDLSGISFRRLYFFAHDEGVTKEFIDGAHILGIRIPPRPEIETLPRFAIKEKSDATKARKLRTLIEILIKLNAEFQSREPNYQLSIINYQLKDILLAYKLLRFRDFDEDRFNILIRKQGIHKFTKRFINHLTDIFDLEPGFNPLQ